LDEVDAILAANPDRLLLVRNADDIVRAKRDGKIAIMLGVEGGKLLEGKIELLQMFYERGLRELQLRWAVPNQIVEDRSLTRFGREVVKACNRLGVIVSLTHIPIEAFFEVIALAVKPPIVCHGVASIPGSGVSDLTNDQLKALAGHGGVVGLHFYTTYLGPRPTVERVVDQVEYIANLVGIETVALGIDLFPTQGAWAKFQRDQGTSNITWAIPHIGEVVQVTEEMLSRNIPEEDVKLVLGGNFLRVCREVFETAS
jgi:membrane dipeptidase